MLHPKSTICLWFTQSYSKCDQIYLLIKLKLQKAALSCSTPFTPLKQLRKCFVCSTSSMSICFLTVLVVLLLGIMLVLILMMLLIMLIRMLILMLIIIILIIFIIIDLGFNYLNQPLHFGLTVPEGRVPPLERIGQVRACEKSGPSRQTNDGISQDFTMSNGANNEDIDMQ